MNKEKIKNANKLYREKLKIRMENDPELKELVNAKRRESNRIFKQLNSNKIRANELRRQHREKAKMELSQIERANQIKLKTFQNSLLSPEERLEELKRCKAKWKKKINDKYMELYGFSYYAYNNIKDKYRLSTIEEVIEYRIKNNLPVKIESIDTLKDEEPKPVTIKDNGIHLTRQNLESIEILKVENPKPVTIKNNESRQTKKNRKYIEMYGVSYSRLMCYRRQLGLDTIEEAIEWYTENKLSNRNGYHRLNDSKEQAYKTMQRKISNLNCVISSESIRDAIINELQQNFYREYGSI